MEIETAIGVQMNTLSHMAGEQITTPPISIYEYIPDAGTSRIEPDGSRTEIDTSEPGFYQASPLRYHP